MSVGTRLKEERKRLGLSQEAMAVACGAGKRTQILFEQDAHVPGGSYFIAADELGVDVSYVLAGRRSQLDEADTELLDAWRKASLSARAAAMNLLSGAEPRVSEKAPRTSFTNTSIGQQISGDVDLRNQKVTVKAPRAARKTAR